MDAAASAGEATGEAPAGGGGFAGFYGRELDGQVRRAFLLVGSNEVANDVVHDAFVAVYRRWDRIDDPGPYLNRAVVNGCRDVHRRRDRHERSVARLVPAAGDDAPGDVLDDVLAGLPFNQRAAVVLRYFGQFSVAETAATLGCPPGSVGPWISRALATMRKALL